MKRRTLRNLLVLCDEAGRLIRSQGRPLPPREDLMRALAPAAKAVTRASRAADQVARLHAEADAVAQAAAQEALDSVAALALSWAGAVPARPAPATYAVPFDPARFQVRLVQVPPGEHEAARAREVA